MSAGGTDLACWATLLALGLVLELLARHGGRFVTIGALHRLVLRCRIARAGLLLGWAWLGWHLFAR